MPKFLGMFQRDKPDARVGSMSEEDMRMIDDWLVKIEQNKGNMGELYDRWEKEHEAYMGDQPIRDNRPNTRVNILHANVEGQVATLVDQNIAVTTRGEGPSDQGFADWARIGLDWTLRKNHLKRLLARHERRRELFGAAVFKIHWDADAIGGYGLAKITCPPLGSIFVDSKITDPEDLEEAEYWAEYMVKSKSWAKEEYGDKADNIYFGGSDRRGIFAKERTTDDDDAFFLVQVWTKTKGILRLVEFSDDGVLLYDSFKDKDKMENGKPKPFYRKNEYPYFLTLLYPEEGKLFGFGDGKLLRPLQDMLNDLYDQIRMASRPNRVFFDPDSEVDLETLDEDDGPVPCEDPNTNIKVVEVGRVNPALWQLVDRVHQEIQRVTRYSELMMGQNSSAKTATEATIQQQQGGSGTDHKKAMLQETLVDVCEYALDLMMENYTEAKMFRIDEDKNDYAWVDFRQLNSIPALIPASEAFTKGFRENHPDKEIPQWMQLTDEEGNGVTKSVELDIEINIGAGMPKNKAFIYQMAEKLSAAVIDGKNLVSWTEMRNFLRDFLGIPLQDDEELMREKMQQAQEMTQSMGGPTQGADVEGLSQGGNPMMSNLPPMPQGPGGMVG